MMSPVTWNGLSNTQKVCNFYIKKTPLSKNKAFIIRKRQFWANRGINRGIYHSERGIKLVGIGKKKTRKAGLPGIKVSK